MAAATAPAAARLPTPRAVPTPMMTSHVPASTVAGAAMRRNRAATQSCGRPFLERWLSSETADEKPPTTKKSGITWKSQLIQAIEGANSSALPVIRSPVGPTEMAMAAQWPTATATMAAAR